MRTFLNTRGAPFVIGLTFTALSFGFALSMLGSLSAFPQVSFINRVIVQVIVYFGFAWIVIILLVLFRDAKNELAQILFAAFLIFLAIMKLLGHDYIGCGIVAKNAQYR